MKQSRLTHLDVRIRAINFGQGTEQATREMAAIPVIDALGWDTFNADEVDRKYSVRGGRVDYCLRGPAHNIALIEVERIRTVHERRHELHVITVADGARDTWRHLKTLAPEATGMADFYHASEHLRSALYTRNGEYDSRGRAQIHKLYHLLLDYPDGVEKVIRAPAYQHKKYPRRTGLGKVLRYFRRNRHRMRYPRQSGPALARPFRPYRGGQKDLGHATAEAFPNAMAHNRWTGHLDASFAAARFPIRPSVAVPIQDPSSRCGRPRQRRGISL